MDFAWRAVGETICLAGPHGLPWNDFASILAKHMNLRSDQVSGFPPTKPFQHLLLIYSHLSPNYEVGVLPAKERFQKNGRQKMNEFVKMTPLKEYNSSNWQQVRFYCANDLLRREILLDGRPIQLSDSSMMALEIIAGHGRSGVTQAELAGLLGCDAKSTFHWLKSLLAFDLIVRVPVSSRKAFTYLITLARFVDEDDSATSVSKPSEFPIISSSVDIRQMIVDVLAKAPAHTMLSKDVFNQTGLAPSLIKNFRRAAGRLNEVGWLEFLFEDQIAGPNCRLFRLKRRPHESLDVKAAIDALKKSENQEKAIGVGKVSRSPCGSKYNPNIPILHQIILQTANRFPDGITTGELCHLLGISRKYLYRLIDRLVPPRPNASGTVSGAEGITKIADFVGKEKRLRLFIRSEEWKTLYLTQFNLNSTHVPPPQEQSRLDSRPSSPSTPILPAGDTLTRQLRHQAILAELTERRIIEVGKELCAQLQKRLGDSRYTLDVKTLRRSIDILERQGDIKTMVVDVPYRSSFLSRTLILLPALQASDFEVGNYIANLRENFRIGPTLGSSLKPRSEAAQRLQEAMSRDDFFVDISSSQPIANGASLTPSMIATRNRQALIHFGFVFGILARARLFHEFILKHAEFESDDSTSSTQIPFFETIPTIFEKMPFKLFLSIIGVDKMSRALCSEIHTLASTTISELPIDFKEELMTLHRKRFQVQVVLLLETLQQLGLIEPDSQHFSANFKLPLKYILSPNAPLYDIKTGRVVKDLELSYGLGSNESAEEFWNELRSLSFKNSESSIASIYESELNHPAVVSAQNVEALLLQLPKAFLLASYPDSWKSRPSRERDLERAVRKLAVEIFSLQKSKARRQNTMAEVSDEVLMQQLSQSIASLATEFDVEPERIEGMFDHYQRKLKERSETRRSSKHAAADYDVEEEYVEDLQIECELSSVPMSLFKWTSSDHLRLQIAFCILQQPAFLAAAAGGIPGIRWNLAVKVFDRSIDPVVIRRHGLKLCRSYAALKRLLEIDTMVQLIIRGMSDVTDFESVFAFVYQNWNKAPLEIIAESDGSLSKALIAERKSHFVETTESWILPRSFRHEILLNDSGLVSRSASSQDIMFDDAVLVLRRLLIYAASDVVGVSSFSPDLAAFALAPFQDRLEAAIATLVDIGFAARTRGKRRYRLFGFPLTLAEEVRSVLLPPSDDWNHLKEITAISINTNNLALHGSSSSGLELLLENCIDGAVKLAPIPITSSLGRFDVPASLEFLQSKPPSLNIDFQNFPNLPNAIWLDLADGHVLESLVNSVSSHLLQVIRHSPGISLAQLGNRCQALLTTDELRFLIDRLQSCGHLECINGQYLQ